MLNWIVWNRTICIKMDLALNNLQRLICHKIKSNKPTCFYIYINYVYDLQTHFVDNILKWAWALFLHTVKWFQVLLYNSHNLTSVICLHIVYSIWSINRTLSDATTPGQSGPGSNGYEGVLHILEISNLLPSDVLMSYPGHSLYVCGGDLTPLQKCSWCILQLQPTGFN